MLKVFRKRWNIFTNLKISKNVSIFMSDIIRIIKIKLTNWTLSILYMYKFDPIFYLIHEQNIQKLHRNCVKERYNRATLINWFVCIRNLWHTYYSYYITRKLNLNREINKSNFQRNFPIEIRFFEIETNFLAINICKFLWPTVIKMFIEQIVIQEIKIRSILTENKSLLEDTVLISLIERFFSSYIY